MSRHVRELSVQDLLVRVPGVPARRVFAEGKVLLSHLRQLPEQEQWCF